MNKAWVSMGAALVLAAGLAACGGEREAESETPVAEAEVKTDLPESTVSDQELQQTADQAAAQASTPAVGTVTPSTDASMAPTTTTTVPSTTTTTTAPAH